jgi:hypothetical protein
MIAPVILDLYSRSGHFSDPWFRAGVDVIRLDIADGNDVRKLEYFSDRSVLGIFACPPCTMFSKARGSAPVSELQLLEAISCVDAIFRFVTLYNPIWWLIENPFHSRIRKYIGNPFQMIRMSWFGFPASKQTGLWGKFKPVKADPGSWNPVRGGHNISMIDNLNTEQRSETPVALGEAFFKANYSGINQPLLCV